MIINAILKINPDAKVIVRGEDLNTCEIEWHQGTPEISKADIQVKMNELQAEYPNHEDCIHALLDGGDTLTDLQAKRTVIKNKYPKE